jgi:tripartite motif-containing protein 71
MAKTNIFLHSFGEILNAPSGITCDHDGNILVCSNLDHDIQVYSKDYNFLYSFGKRGIEDGEFNHPGGITCDQDGNILVCDMGNHRIQVFKLEKKTSAPQYKFFFSFGQKSLFCPNVITCDRNGNILVSNNHNIQVFTSQGEFIFSFGQIGKKEGEFYNPCGITCDHDGNILVCDLNNHRVQVFSSDYKFLYSFGEGRFPHGITTDFEGNIIVSDLIGYIQNYKKTQSKYEFIYSIEKQNLQTPRDITTDSKGNILVASIFDHQIHVFKGPSEVPTLLSMCWKHVDEILNQWVEE